MTHYIDMTNTEGCFGILPENGETIVFAGVSLYSMPLSVKSREGELYADFARKYGIHFIFDDEKPVIDFYAVPSLEIGATDGAGGFIASVGAPFSLRDPVCLVYIAPDRSCYRITEDGSEFFSMVSRWRNCLTPYDAVKLYGSKEQAKAEFEILDFEKTEVYRQHIAAFPK